ATQGCGETGELPTGACRESRLSFFLLPPGNAAPQDVQAAPRGGFLAEELSPFPTQAVKIEGFQAVEGATGACRPWRRGALIALRSGNFGRFGPSFRSSRRPRI